MTWWSLAEVVFLGEVHDNPLHHISQAELLAKLTPTAVVFEMLTPEQAARMQAGPVVDADSLSALLEWDTSGWPEIEIYFPIFDALGDAKVIGAGSPRAVVRAAFSDGAAAVFGDGAARFGLDQPLPAAELSQRKQLQFDAHCQAMPMDMMGGMVEAQRFRDARIAAAALDALDRYGPPVAVITGNGHAQTLWGAGAMARDAGAQVVSVGHMELPQRDEPGFDRIIWTKAADREDPCAAFN